MINQALDLRGKSFKVGDRVIYRAGKGINLATVTKIVNNYTGTDILRIGVEIDKYRADGSVFKYRYNVDYRPNNFVKVAVERNDDTGVVV